MQTGTGRQKYHTAGYSPPPGCIKVSRDQISKRHRNVSILCPVRLVQPQPAAQGMDCKKILYRRKLPPISQGRSSTRKALWRIFPFFFASLPHSFPMLAHAVGVDVIEKLCQSASACFAFFFSLVFASAPGREEFLRLPTTRHAVGETQRWMKNRFCHVFHHSHAHTDIGTLPRLKWILVQCQKELKRRAAYTLVQRVPVTSKMEYTHTPTQIQIFFGDSLFLYTH